MVDGDDDDVDDENDAISEWWGELGRWVGLTLNRELRNGILDYHAMAFEQPPPEIGSDPLMTTRFGCQS